jgi:hypothetical protein
MLFNVISAGIPYDSSGRVFIRTALNSARSSRRQPEHMAIDVLRPDREIPDRRLSFDGSATHIGVSPDCATIYLIHARRQTIRAHRKVS